MFEDRAWINLAKERINLDCKKYGLLCGRLFNYLVGGACLSVHLNVSELITLIMESESY